MLLKILVNSLPLDGCHELNGKEVPEDVVVVVSIDDVVDVPEKLGTWLLKNEVAESDTADASKPRRVRSVPSQKLLTAAGIDSRDQLAALIAEHKDEWATKVPGLKPAAAAKIMQWMADTADMDAEDKAESKADDKPAS